MFSCVPEDDSPAAERLVGSTAAQNETIHPDWQVAAEQQLEGHGQWVFRLCSHRALLVLEKNHRSNETTAAEALLSDAEDPVQRSHDLKLIQELQQSPGTRASSPVVARIELLRLDVVMRCGCGV